MPIDLPNIASFRPFYPKSKDSHVLFGPKYHKMHQFRDTRWLPTAPINQYRHMVNFLGKNLTFKKLERDFNIIKEKKTLKSIRKQCRDGRIQLRSAKQGDLTRISNILINHHHLRRMYQYLPSHLIVEKINQLTFLKRKENDRLNCKLKKCMDIYGEKLMEQSKLEQRIKYESETILQEEILSRNCRKELSNSITRIQAFKLINRAYQKILETLQRDDKYLESILNSLEDDILEQSNFIKQVVLLGIPAMKKYRILADEYKKSEDIFRDQIRTNLLFIAQYKKRVKDEEDHVKLIVRKNCDSPGKKHVYVRETSSMISLRNSIEELDKTVQKIKNATFSPLDTDIMPKMEKTVFQNIIMEKRLVLEDEMMFRLTDKEIKCAAMMSTLINNSYEIDNERLKMLKELEDGIKKEKREQQSAIEYIIKNGIIFDRFRLTLWSITDIMRHIGTNLPYMKQQYPIEELKLPLLNFAHQERTRVSPPLLKNIDMEKLLDICRDRINLLMQEYRRIPPSVRKQFNHANKIYSKVYVESTFVLFDKMSTEPRKSLDFATEKTDVNIPNRDQMKLASIKIVNDHKMRQEYEMT